MLTKCYFQATVQVVLFCDNSVKDESISVILSTL